ncbi:MAG: hypothetical protein KKB85_03750 [Candidatus Altiarchaeota archaeon]|nr:hypothetical protein [Candidatus Altiarchaeota archaeon]
MYAYDFEGVRYDLGNKADYIKATIEYALRREEFSSWMKDYLKTLMK